MATTDSGHYAKRTAATLQRARSITPVNSVATALIASLISLTVIACSGPSATSDGDNSPTATDAGPVASSFPSAASPASTESPQETDTGIPPTQPVSATSTAEPPVATTPPAISSPATATAPEAATVIAPPTPPETAEPVAATPDPVNASVRFDAVATGFVEPTLLTHASDGSGTLYVTEKRGAIYTLDGRLFMDITDRVIDTGLEGNARELGLLGLAFHPEHAANGQFFVHYNDESGNTVISRFRTNANGVGDPGSEEILLALDQPEDHFNGGTILFGPDGYLYIALGTGGNRTIDHLNSQNINSLFGKILRIDVDAGDPYGIPPDNPFAETPAARPEVWVFGLRNPWRFDFDEVTGDIYIAEPGQFGYEWVHFQAAGPNGVPPGAINYGWPVFEGTHCFDLSSSTSSESGDCIAPLDYQPPIIEYPRGQNGGCVIIGGSVYRGTAIAQLNGAYLYSDFCSGVVSAAWRDTNGVWQSVSVGNLPGLVSSFGEDESGEVYVLSISEGAIYKLLPV